MTLEKLSPIALFVYNRPYHTKKTIEYLSKNVYAQNSDLFIFSDSPKNPAEVSKVNEVRNYCHDIKSFKSIKVILREKNLGLAKNITDGISDILKKNEKVIVLEDDLLTDRYFLKYMNEALNKFKNSEDVISIHGYIYPLKKQFDNPSFLKGADCWGWATWKRAWDVFEPNGQKILDELKSRGLEKGADFNNSYGLTQMLKDQIKGKNNSWAVRWYMSAFLKDMLTLYPGKSYVQNIGNDDSGTHCGVSDIFRVELSTSNNINRLELVENSDSRKKMEIFFHSINGTFIQKLKTRIKRFIK